MSHHMTLGWHFCLLGTCLVHACSDTLTTCSLSFLNRCTSGNQMKRNLGKRTMNRKSGDVWSQLSSCRPDFKPWLCLWAAVKLWKLWPCWASVFSPSQGKRRHPQKRKRYFFFSCLSAYLWPNPHHSGEEFLIKWFKIRGIQYAPLASRQIQCALSGPHTSMRSPWSMASSISLLSLHSIDNRIPALWRHTPFSQKVHEGMDTANKEVIVFFPFFPAIILCFHRVQSWVSEGMEDAL